MHARIFGKAKEEALFLFLAAFQGILSFSLHVASRDTTDNCAPFKQINFR